ncbi:MAG: dGTPase [Alphaproteobacteria bacterium]|jgi:dGTPase
MKKYAAIPLESKGRFHEIQPTNGRDCYQRDRDRIIHSKAFRRLAHKTQVFVYYEGDHYRNRLTHSLEVAQISRACARILQVNEDLTELTALAHDLGHPPFGHAGEDALNDMMTHYGGYDHNAQALRIVTLLEDRYPHHSGLNLTIESLEGILKHNGPIISDNHLVTPFVTPRAILAFEHHKSLDLNLYAGIEAQIAAICDDIAYNAHDIDDGLRANLFDIDSLRQLPFCASLMETIKNDYPKIQPYQFKHEFIRRLISYFVSDMIATTQKNLRIQNPQSYDDVRHASQAFVAFSNHVNQENLALKKFLFQNMYRHYKVLRMTSKAKRVIHSLFKVYFDEPDIMPFNDNNHVIPSDVKDKAIFITDFIAGMTDKFALEEYRRLFELIPEQL